MPLHGSRLAFSLCFMRKMNGWIIRVFHRSSMAQILVWFDHHNTQSRSYKINNWIKSFNSTIFEKPHEMVMIFKFNRYLSHMKCPYLPIYQVGQWPTTWLGHYCCTKPIGWLRSVLLEKLLMGPSWMRRKVGPFLLIQNRSSEKK